VPEIERDLFADEDNPTRIKAAMESLLIPDGWYQTEVPFGCKETTDRETGRPYANFYGALLQDGESVGRISFRFSPALVEKDGKPDWWFQQYVALRKVYVAAMGNAPKSPRDVITFLTDYPIMVKIGRGVNRKSEELENKVYAFGKVRD